MWRVMRPPTSTNMRMMIPKNRLISGTFAFYRRLSKAVYQHPAGQPVRDAIEGRHLEMLRTEQARRDSDTPS